MTSVDEHTGWSIGTRQQLKLRDELGEPWRAGNMFPNGDAGETREPTHSR